MAPPAYVSRNYPGASVMNMNVARAAVICGLGLSTCLGGCVSLITNNYYSSDPQHPTASGSANVAAAGTDTRYDDRARYPYGTYPAEYPRYPQYGGYDGSTSDPYGYYPPRVVYVPYGYDRYPYGYYPPRVVYVPRESETASGGESSGGSVGRIPTSPLGGGYAGGSSTSQGTDGQVRRRPSDSRGADDGIHPYDGPDVVVAPADRPYGAGDGPILLPPDGRVTMAPSEPLGDIDESASRGDDVTGRQTVQGGRTSQTAERGGATQQDGATMSGDERITVTADKTTRENGREATIRRTDAGGQTAQGGRTSQTTGQARTGGRSEGYAMSGNESTPVMDQAARENGYGATVRRTDGGEQSAQGGRTSQTSDRNNPVETSRPTSATSGGGQRLGGSVGTSATMEAADAQQRRTRVTTSQSSGQVERSGASMTVPSPAVVSGSSTPTTAQSQSTSGRVRRSSPESVSTTTPAPTYGSRVKAESPVTVSAPAESSNETHTASTTEVSATESHASATESSQSSTTGAEQATGTTARVRREAP